jgi:hypothetical protein
MENPLRLVCGHVFCRDCIHTACQGTLKPLCPLCRGPIPTADVPIFVDSLPDTESDTDSDTYWDDSSDRGLEGIIIWGPTAIDSDGDPIGPSDDESDPGAVESGTESDESGDSVEF